MKYFTTSSRLLSFSLLLSVFFLLHNTVQAQDADDIVNQLQNKYANIDALEATFTQEITSPFGEQGAISTGTLLLSGVQYRVETENQTFVTDGTTTWIFNAYANQLLVNDFVQDETTFSIADFLLNFNEAYHVLNASQRVIDGEIYYEMEMEPKEDNTYFKRVTLWMRDSDSLVTRLHVLDVNDAELEFNLQNIQLNPNLGSDAFQFYPPDNVEIIDLRS